MLKSIHKAQYKLLCEILVARRKALGISQHELAGRLQRPQSFIAKIEGAERRMDVLEFLDISRALETDPCAILREVEGHSATIADARHT